MSYKEPMASNTIPKSISTRSIALARRAVGAGITRIMVGAMVCGCGY